LRGELGGGDPLGGRHHFLVCVYQSQSLKMRGYGAKQVARSIFLVFVEIQPAGKTGACRL